MHKEFMLVTLADDDEDDRLLFTDAFDELKVSTVVNTFNNGKLLMDYLLEPENVLPHIIFLDLNMPIMNGIECLKEIKQNDRLKNIAIAIYSTSSSNDDIEETFVLGANVYIKKPADFKKLKDVLNEVITVNWQYYTSGLNKENFLLQL